MNEVSNNSIVSLISKAGDDSANNISDALIELMISGSSFPGFLSADITPSSNTQKDWILIQRFRIAEQVTKWQESSEHHRLIEKISSFYPNNNFPFSQEKIITDNHKGNTAIAIVNEVKPGMENEYKDWEIKIKSWQAKFPGYKGTFIQGPTEGTKGRWTT